MVPLGKMLNSPSGTVSCDGKKRVAGQFEAPTAWGFLKIDGEFEIHIDLKGKMV